MGNSKPEFLQISSKTYNGKRKTSVICLFKAFCLHISKLLLKTHSSIIVVTQKDLDGNNNYNEPPNKPVDWIDVAEVSVGNE